MSLQRFTAFFLALSISVFQAMSLDFVDGNQVFVEEKNSQEFQKQEYQNEIEILSSENLASINENKTKITIKCNAPSANVYLNGQYEGKTTLVLNNLSEGIYTLRIEKEGWQTKRYRINVKKGQEETFYIELRRYEGLVSFKTEQEGTEISVDGEKVEYPTLYLNEGKHFVEAKKFGYKAKIQEIFVFRNTYQVISINLERAAFSIKNFKANKNSFNPSLPGNIGTIKFSFTVSAPGKALFKIIDKEKNIVISKQLDDFSTWQQELFWDGKTNEYFAVKDGLYTAILEWENSFYSLDFYADSSIKIPYTSFTAGGLGIGTVPQAFRIPKDTKVFGAEGGIILTSQDNIFYASPITLSFAYAALDFVEFSARGGTLAGYKKNSPFFNLALKFAFEKKYENLNFDSAFFLRFGGIQNRPFFPYGADNGGGAGGGFAFGIDFSSFYAGFTSEFTYGTSTYATENDNYDSILKNSFALQFKQEKFAISLYSSIHSSFGTTGLENDSRKSNSVELLRAFETGIDFKIRPFYSLSFIIFKANAIIFNEQKYFKAETGILVFL
ncbi:PEGA domain-containing protein [Treponema pectinovorum]|uniref:PEGA domain-containing protein n=1 Tax=Treponema pectinovorum TaxID=164 RepID=UPI003D8F9019